MYDRGISISEIAKNLEINKKTVQSMISVYQKENRLTKKSTGHRPKIITSDQAEAMRSWLNDNCQLTLNNIQEKFEATFGTRPSIATIYRCITRGFHYTIKMLSIVLENRNCQRTIDLRHSYAIEYTRMMIDKGKMFFIDEFGISLSTRRNHGWSEVGHRANQTVRAIRSPNHSVCAAMNVNSMFFFEMSDKPYNSEDYAEFLNKLFEHFANLGIEGAYLIMDNVRFHKTEEVQNLIASHGHHAVFLPPYSPFFNPIENAFNQWKAIIKQRFAKNVDELRESVDFACNQIKQSDCNNYFRHMESYLSKCLNKEPILN